MNLITGRIQTPLVIGMPSLHDSLRNVERQCFFCGNPVLVENSPATGKITTVRLIHMPPIPPSPYFPTPDVADEDGLLAVGGDLTPPVLLDAYIHGIFPWPVGDDDYPLTWFSPDPRAVFEFSKFHTPKRLGRTIRSNRFESTCDQAFEQVMIACATAQGRAGETWITQEMINAYVELHRLGVAHSVESWRNGRLVGGVYGLAIRGMFAAESMFYLEQNASKVALCRLVIHAASRGYQLFDIQQMTDNARRFGAVEISRAAYIERLDSALDFDVTFGDRLEPIDFCS